MMSTLFGRDDIEPMVLVIAGDPLERHDLVRAVAAAGHRTEGFPTLDAVARTRRPTAAGCILLDVERPGLDGLSDQERLLRAGFVQPLIVLSSYGEVAVAVRALQRGAFDLIEKPWSASGLLSAVEQALALDATRRRRAGERAGFLDRVQLLTAREREVMAMVVQGKANKVVALELGISEKTVETHRARVMGKMAVGSLAELVRLDTLHGAPDLSSERRPLVGRRARDAQQQRIGGLLRQQIHPHQLRQ